VLIYSGWFSENSRGDLSAQRYIYLLSVLTVNHGSNGGLSTHALAGLCKEIETVLKD
jgi:hypothetical protein